MARRSTKTSPDTPPSLQNNEMQVETAENLRNSLARFQSLFKAFPLSVYVWQCQENDFILVDYNDADQPAINAVIRKFLGRGIRFMYPQGDRMLADIECCYQEKRTFSREYKSYRVPYTHQVKDLNVTYVFCHPDLVMVIFNDMTELHSTVEELRQLSSAVEQTADAVFITNKDGIIEYANLGFEQMTGFARAEVVGNNPRIMKSGQMPLEYYQTLWQTILDGIPFRSQTVNRRRNGEMFIAEQTITPMKNPEGEITHFVSVLKDMTDRIRSQEMETEHQLAGKVQKQLFPIHTPEIPGYEIAGAVFSARHTSGDYFDYVSMPGDNLGIVVADVCDHGLGSALIMAKTQAHLRSIMHYESNPRIVLRELNYQMQPDLLDSMFITMSLGILDPQHHQLEYANAGNTPTFILDQDGEIIHELRTDGLPIGLFQDLVLRQRETIQLPPGSVTVFLTDGFHEAFDENGRQFGFPRLLDVIRSSHLASAQEIIDRVSGAVLEFSGSVEQTDDQTIVVCKRVP